MPMTAVEREAIRAKLEAEYQANQEHIATLEAVTRPIAPENAIGRVSRMDAINNKSINEAALVKARKQNVHLERALTRIEEPTFGVCMRCQQPIPVGRLMLMPATTRCVRCAGR